MRPAAPGFIVVDRYIVRAADDEDSLDLAGEGTLDGAEKSPAVVVDVKPVFLQGDDTVGCLSLIA